MVQHQLPDKDSSSSDSDKERDSDEESSESGDHCCPDHRFEDFKARKCSDVFEVYENICEKSKKMLFGAPIVLVNKEF
jgi:hypothetical protein